MKNSCDFRVGFQPFNLMPPADMARGVEQYKWTIDECARIGARAISLTPNLIPEAATSATLSELADMANEADVKLIMYPFAVWGLAGLPIRTDNWGAVGATFGASSAGDIPNVLMAHAGVEKMIEMASILGSNIFCSGYGHLNVATSRYNKEFPFAEQKKFIIANLREMSRMLQGTGISFAYENHCDFNGREIASILDEVDSKNVGALYDFGNGAVACCDPMEDVKYLAPYAVAAHFKDFKVVDSPYRTKENPDMPMVTTGCYLGEGYIDFELILREIIEKSPNPCGMPLLAEPAFQLPTSDAERSDRTEYNRKISRQYVAKMLEIVQEF